MPSYNATLELDTPASRIAGGRADRILAKLDGYHPVVAASLTGGTQLIITLPAPDLPTAALRAHRLVPGLAITRSTVEPSSRFDDDSSGVPGV